MLDTKKVALIRKKVLSGLVSVRILGSKSDEKADMKKKPLKQYKVSSFFAGIGGFDLGLEKAGMEVVFQCEINKFCQKVLRKNWSKVPLHTDITRLNADEIPESNVWCGGFPCRCVVTTKESGKV